MRRDESFHRVSLAFDRTTFDRLVVEHLPAMQRFAVRLTGDATSAEDLVQDALLRAHRSWQTFRGESKFQTWLFQIVINVFRDRRTVEPQIGIDAGLASHAQTPLMKAQSRELGELVAAEISRLPPRQREVLVLITYEALSIREVAGILSVTEQNVRTNLHYAREALRQRLRNYLDDR